MQMFNHIINKIRKVVATMAVVYATLIIKEQVKQVLIDLDCGDLAE